MKTISKLLFISSLTLGCASTRVARSPIADLRGDVIVHGPSIKAVVVGPAELHAYAGFRGGKLYAAPAVAGRDRDCAAVHAEGTLLAPDRVGVMRVDAGQVACLATANQGSFELVWHARLRRLGEITVASAGAAR